MKCAAILGDFRAAGSQLRVHENTSSVASGCLRLLSGAPDAVTHPIRSVPEFRGLLLPVRSCSCPQVKCKRSVGGRFLSHFVYPKFRPISTTAAPQARGVGLCCESAEGQSEENHKLLWMKHSWLPPAICKARTSQRCNRSVLKMAAMFLFR